MDGPLPALLFIIMPSAGMAVSALLAWRSFSEAKAEGGTISQPAASPDRPMGRFLVLIQLMATSPVFGFVCFMLVRLGSPLADDAVVAIGFCVGMSGLCTTLGQGIVARAAARDIVARPKNFGRHIVVMAQLETVMILAFMIAVLSILPGRAPANLSAANYIMGISSVGALVSGLLSADVDPSQMFKRTIRVLAGEGIALAGFLAAFVLLRVA